MTRNNLADLLSMLKHWPRNGLMGLVRGYRFFLSPWLGSACRFEPTCSRYALTALKEHGAMMGTGLTVARLARCHPWCAGGHDPVPLAPLPPVRLFTRWVGRTTERPSTEGHLTSLPKSIE